MALAETERQQLLVEGPAGRLEAVLHLPANLKAGRAVVAHPHPLYGGTMDSAVVLAVVESLVGLGVPTLRFNFRGVGQSEGQHDQGVGEVDDLRAALAEMAGRYPAGELSLAGYSFGAVMAFQSTLRDLGTAAQPGFQPARLLVLAPPVTHYDFSKLSQLGIPVAGVCGQADDLTPRAAVESLLPTSEPLTSPSQGLAMPQFSWLQGKGHDLGSFEDPGALEDALTASWAGLGLSR